MIPKLYVANYDKHEKTEEQKKEDKVTKQEINEMTGKITN